MRRIASGFLLAVALLILAGSPILAADCEFRLGFKTLRDLIGYDIVGECLENERYSTAGNWEQRTTGGMLVWRSSDYRNTFTDGYYTWINGPNGLQKRLNYQRFAWESVIATPLPTPMPTSTPTPQPVHVLRTGCEADRLVYALYREWGGNVGNNGLLRGMIKRMMSHGMVYIVDIAVNVEYAYTYLGLDYPSINGEPVVSSLDFCVRVVANSDYRQTTLDTLWPYLNQEWKDWIDEQIVRSVSARVFPVEWEWP